MAVDQRLEPYLLALIVRLLQVGVESVNEVAEFLHLRINNIVDQGQTCVHRFVHRDEGAEQLRGVPNEHAVEELCHAPVYFFLCRCVDWHYDSSRCRTPGVRRGWQPSPAPS